MPNWNAEIVYRAKSGSSLLDREKLTRIHHIERNITAMKNWKYLCLAESVSNSRCHPDKALVSPLRAFDGFDYKKASDFNIRTRFMETIVQNLQWDKIKDNFGRHEDIFWTNGKRVGYARSFLSFAAPIDMPDTDFKSRNDRIEEQLQVVADFQYAIQEYL